MDKKNQKKVPITLIFQNWTQQFLQLFSQSAILIEFFAERGNKQTNKQKCFIFNPSVNDSNENQKTRDWSTISTLFRQLYHQTEKFSQLFVKVLLWSQKTELSHSFQTRKNMKIVSAFFIYFVMTSKKPWLLPRSLTAQIVDS